MSQDSDYVLVPLDPNATMIVAGAKHIGGGSTFDQGDRHEMAAAIYRAMLAAAPSRRPPMTEWIDLRRAAELADEIWAALDEARRGTNLTDVWYIAAEHEGRRIIEFCQSLTPSPNTDRAQVAALAEAETRQEPGATFQSRVEPWMMACFGPEISADRLERSDRFIEEAIELVQACSYPKERVLALVDYVYGRDQGEIDQEVGGVMVTLAAHCLAHGVDMHEAAETELARIWTKVDKIRAKQAAKPTGSALPIATHPSPTVTDEMVERAARAMCKSGRFETGEGTCALVCMSSLGDARKSCPHAATVHYPFARAALTAALKVKP